jgi:plastocyanin
MTKRSRRSAFKFAMGAGVVAGMAAGQEHPHQSISGPLATATVSFGQWKTDPPVDRFPNVSPAGGNANAITPNEVTIKAGGSVNFVIAGLHQVVIYDDGTQASQINTTQTIGTTGVPPGVPLVNDPNRRVFRGLDPSTQTRDRVEVVQFSKPGRYLVICGILSHFLGGMTGFVQVLP